MLVGMHEKPSNAGGFRFGRNHAAKRAQWVVPAQVPTTDALHVLAAEKEAVLFIPVNSLPPTILDGITASARVDRHDYLTDLFSLRFLAFCPFLRHGANGRETLPRSVVQLGNFMSNDGVLEHIRNTGGVLPLLEGIDCAPEEVAFINLLAGEAANPRALQGIDFFPPLGSALGQISFLNEFLLPGEELNSYALMQYAAAYEMALLADYKTVWEAEQVPRLKQQGMQPKKIDAFRARLEAHIRAATEKYPLDSPPA